MSVAARCSQIGMTDLTLCEVGRNSVLLQVTHTPVPKGVHPALLYPEQFADWLQHLPHYVVSFERGSVLPLIL